MERNYLNYILIAVFIFFIFSIIFYVSNKGVIKDPILNKDSNLKLTEKNLEKENIQTNISKWISGDNSKENIQDSSSSYSKNTLKELPSDINNSNCGFYYADYGVCAGNCPEGNCISEGRSCYCKRIN